MNFALANYTLAQAKNVFPQGFFFFAWANLSLDRANRNFAQANYTFVQAKNNAIIHEY